MTTSFCNKLATLPACLLLVFSLTAFGKTYKGAEYRTIDSFLYGRYEVRMQSAAGHGVVSSFFTFHDFGVQGLGPETWNEIDLEWMGKLNNKVSTNVIIQNQWGEASEVFLTVNPHLDFNSYAFEWTPDAIRFYEGERLLRTVSGYRADSVHYAQKLMMNIWQPSNANWAGTFDPSVLPVYAIYDWASYSEYTPGSGSVGTDNNFTPAWVDNFDAWDTSRWQKASHTWDGNNCDFIASNAVFTGGYLVLCLTTATNTGYNGPPLSIQGGQGAIPTDFRLYPAYPNPFNGEVRLALEVPESVDLSLNIYDTSGALKHHSAITGRAGELQTISWDGKNQAGDVLASGSYIVQVQSSSQQVSQKVVLLK